LARATGGEFSAYWNSATSEAVPTSGWQLLGTFTLSNTSDRVGLFHKTGTASLS
jgi:hypothetical protein